MLQFPALPFPVFPTTADLIATCQERLAKVNALITDISPGGVTEQYFEAIAILLGLDADTLPGISTPGLYDLLNQVIQGAYITTAKGIYLDFKCADVGVFRKQATQSIGANGRIHVGQHASPITFPAGSLVAMEVADPTQPPVAYALTSDITIPGGQVAIENVGYRSVSAGSQTLAPIGAINQAIGLPGATFTNLDAAIGGTDTEEDDSPNGGLRRRGLEAIPNAQQCTKAAIEQDMLTYPTITSAVLVPTSHYDTGGHTLTFQRGEVTIFVDDGSGDLSDNNPTLVAQIQADLTKGLYRAGGDAAFVYGSQVLTVTVAVTVDVSQDYNDLVQAYPFVLDAVQAALIAYIRGLPIGSPVTRSALAQVIEGVNGVSNVVLSTLLLNGSAADLIPTIPYQTPRTPIDGSLVTVTLGTLTPYGH